MLEGGQYEDHRVYGIDRRIDFVGNYTAKSTSYFFRYYPQFHFYT